MHEKKISKTGENRPNQPFGQNDDYLTKFRLYEQSQKKTCGYEWDEAFAVVYSEIPHTIIAFKL